MFYTEILPSALPVMMHPYGRTASPYSGCPLRMSTCGQETRPRPCKQRQQPTYDDFLSRLFQFSESEDKEESREAPAFEELLKALFNKGAMKHACSKGKCRREAMKNTDSSKDQNKYQKEEKKSQSEDEADATSDRANENTVIATLNMRGYDPNSIEVKISDANRIVKIIAKHAIFTPCGPMMRQNSHAVPIPEGVSPKDIRSFISPDGILYLKASSRQDSKTTSDKEGGDKPLEEPDVEVKETTNSTDSAEEANTNPACARNEDAESPVSDSTQANAASLDNTHNGSPTETPHEANQEAANTTENTYVEISDTEHSKELDQDSDHTAPEHGFVVVGSDNEGTAEATNATPDTTETDEANHLTVAEFDMAGFSADDISVTVNEESGFMEVSAKRGGNTENGRFVREYYRAFPIPEGFSGNGFQTNFTTEGLFSIKAPRIPKALAEAE